MELPVVPEVPLKVGHYKVLPCRGKLKAGRGWKFKEKQRWCNYDAGLTLKLLPNGIAKVTHTKHKPAAQPSTKWTSHVLHSTPPLEDIRDRRELLLAKLSAEVPTMEAGQRIGIVLSGPDARALTEQVRSMKRERVHWKQFSQENPNAFLSFYVFFPRFFLFTLPFGKECDEVRRGILEDWVTADSLVDPLLDQASVCATIRADALLTFGKICRRLELKDKALLFYDRAWQTSRYHNLYLQMLDVANSYSRSLIDMNQKGKAKEIIEEAVGTALFNLLKLENEQPPPNSLRTDPWRRTAARLRGKLRHPAKETGAYLLSCE